MSKCGDPTSLNLSVMCMTIFLDSSETLFRVSFVILAEQASLNPCRCWQILRRMKFSTEDWRIVYGWLQYWESWRLNDNKIMGSLQRVEQETVTSQNLVNVTDIMNRTRIDATGNRLRLKDGKRIHPKSWSDSTSLARFACEIAAWLRYVDPKHETGKFKQEITEGTFRASEASTDWRSSSCSRQVSWSGQWHCNGRCSKIHNSEIPSSGVKSRFRNMTSADWWQFVQVIERIGKSAPPIFTASKRRKDGKESNQWKNMSISSKWSMTHRRHSCWEKWCRRTSSKSSGRPRENQRKHESWKSSSTKWCRRRTCSDGSYECRSTRCANETWRPGREQRHVVQRCVCDWEGKDTKRTQNLTRKDQTEPNAVSRKRDWWMGEGERDEERKKGGEKDSKDGNSHWSDDKDEGPNGNEDNNKDKNEIRYYYDCGEQEHLGVNCPHECFKSIDDIDDQGSSWQSDPEGERQMNFRVWRGLM